MQRFSLLKVCCRQIRLILHTTQPARFIAEQGAIAQQGFASSEPYAYKNVYEEWGKDVAITLLNDNGFPIYSQTIAIKPSMKDEMDLPDRTRSNLPAVSGELPRRSRPHQRNDR